LNGLDVDSRFGRGMEFSEAWLLLLLLLVSCMCLCWLEVEIEIGAKATTVRVMLVDMTTMIAASFLITSLILLFENV